MRKWWLWTILVIPAVLSMGIVKEPKQLIVEKSDKKIIEIKGAVAKNGVYEIKWEATVAQVLEKAGGATAKADLSRINQTRVLENGEVLVIPTKQEKTCISINTASAEQLDSLKGVGVKIAERIIKEREIAPFQQLEDIKRVKGIGDKLFEKMKNDICL